MKKLACFTALLFLSLLVFSSSESELAEGKRLVGSNASCSVLSDEQLELIGDYLMEQAHPGEEHEVMDRMMGGEGSENLKWMHVNMARRAYCNEPAYYGMMGAGGFGGGMMNGWNGMMGYGTWNVFSITFWVLVLIASIFVIAWLYKLLARSSAGNGDPLEILKARYAKGEISKRKYAEMKKEIEK